MLAWVVLWAVVFEALFSVGFFASAGAAAVLLPGTPSASPVAAAIGGPVALLLWDAEGRLHALDPEGSWDLDVVEPGLRAPTYVG